MPVKLHTCSLSFIHGAHPCWRVQKALDDAGISYEHVKHPVWRGRRKELKALSGQHLLPVIELADGTVVRGQSKQMAQDVREGKLAAAHPGGTA